MIDCDAGANAVVYTVLCGTDAGCVQMLHTAVSYGRSAKYVCKGMPTVSFTWLLRCQTQPRCHFTVLGHNVSPLTLIQP